MCFHEQFTNSMVQFVQFSHVLSHTQVLVHHHMHIHDGTHRQRKLSVGKYEI